MDRLSEEEVKFITQCLKEGKPLPDSYRHVIPFETKKEYELTYAEKEREEDILADTMAVPLQPLKTFGNGGEGWTNMLIFGDNLQALKYLKKLQDKRELEKIKLVYIDPPFGTGDIYDVKGAGAYSAAIRGAEYIEFLRKRLIFLRELLADGGSIYVRTDYHFGHYLKIIMDEIFGKSNFKNELIVNRIYKNVFGDSKFIPTSTDSIYVYFRPGRSDYDNVLEEREKIRGEFWRHMDDSAGIRHPRERKVFNKVLYPPPNKHFKYNQKAIDKMILEGRIRLKCKGCGYSHDGPNKDWKGCPRCKNDNVRLEYLVKESAYTHLQSNWTDIPGYSNTTSYPTENSEVLLERIIKTGSKEGEVVLDCFAGSGTTGVVAEKLGRKWIMIDCGKLAVYTMQKRLLNLKAGIGQKGKTLKPRPFTLYNAGLYDYQMIKQLPWEQYRDFALKLFQCRDEKHRIAGVELDGYLGADDVLVFNYKKHEDVVLDREFIDDLHRILGERIRSRFFIIAPAASVSFLEDYIEKDKTKYFILRIPYSIIDELHKKGFTHIKQPVGEADVNDTVDAVGFDFIQPPEVECKYSLDKKSRECVIKIKKFESKIISKKPLKFENLETLSMVMVGYDYDGEVFDFDDVFYAKDVKQKNYEVRFDSSKIKGQMMIIYLDIFGNEKREIKKLTDFRG